MTDELYYAASQTFSWYTGDAEEFTLDKLVPIGRAYTDLENSDVWVYINTDAISDRYYTITSGVLTFNEAVTLEDEDLITVSLKQTNYGSHRYTSLADIISNFMVAYVGDGKIINRTNRRDVLFHTKRAIQEFSYDIFKVEKIQEIEVGPTLAVPMPKDYVNYVSISYVDSQGVEHLIPRGTFTSKPSEAISQDDNFNYQFDSEGNVITTTSVADDRFKDLSMSTLNGDFSSEDQYLQGYNTIVDGSIVSGGRFGGDPYLMNRNGFFIIDEANGTINFTSNLSGAVITIKYISDGVGSESEMKVPKLAEEAIYKYVAHAILSTMAQVPEYIVARFKKERRAAMRNAKLRLYDLKLPELTQVMRGKSKMLKH